MASMMNHQMHNNPRKRSRASMVEGAPFVALAPPFVSAPLLQTPEEVTRTVYVSGLPVDLTLDQLTGLFAICGAISYCKLVPGPDEVPAGGTTMPRFAFIEFTEDAGFHNALALNGYVFAERPLRVSTSLKPLRKPLLVAPDTVPAETLQRFFLNVAKVNTRHGVSDPELIARLAALSDAT
jgi:RNA recognition motif-containing protein